MVVICIIFLSAWFGNIVTSFFYRLPKNISIHRETSPPMCSICGEKLQFFEYMPLFYRCFYGKKSHCCNQDIPQVYTAIELTVIVSSVISYFILGLDNVGLCTLLIIPVLTCIGFVFYYNKFIPKDLIWVQIICVTLYKLYALKEDLPDIVFISCFVYISLIAIEKICKKYIDTNLRTTLVCLATIVPTGVYGFSYMMFVFIAWFALCHNLVSAKITISLAIFFCYFFMLLN